jgi:hypothetical protein
MNLEPDLIKKNLEYGEENFPEKRPCQSSQIDIKGFSKEQIIFHVYLLWREGYIECDDTIYSREHYSYKNLTMNGYQYLNLLQSKAWKTAQNMIKDLGVIFVEGAIKAVIDKYSPTMLS